MNLSFAYVNRLIRHNVRLILNPLLIKLKKLLINFPFLHIIAIKILSVSPWLKRRLMQLMMPLPIQSNVVPSSLPTSSYILSPAANAIYRQLKSSIMHNPRQ